MLKACAEAAEADDRENWTAYLPHAPWGVWRAGRDQGWRAPKWWRAELAAGYSDGHSRRLEWWR